MQKDIFGNNRIKLGLHHHTTISDGKRTTEEVAAIYKEAGYDAIAITDHWAFCPKTTIDGMHIISGAEYNICGNDARNGVYHIVSIFADTDPEGERTMSAQQLIDVIHDAGGLAVLAHPAWSLNTPEEIMKLSGIDALEIYNTVSHRGMSRREDSSLLVDMLGTKGRYYPLLASDDSHYYGHNGWEDSQRAFIMVRCDELDNQQLKQAIIKGDFYASTGPEIHLTRHGDTFHVDCSAVQEIVFMSNLTWVNGRVICGEDLTHAEYAPRPGEIFVRAYVTDREGRQAWSCCIPIEAD